MSKVKKINDIKDININKLLEELAKERPIFHNEQDFQFELARKISEKVSENIKVRLEYFIGETNQKNEGIGETNQKNEEIGKKEKEKKNRIYIDIMIIQGNRAIAIELKYKTKISEGKCKNEVFHLKDQGAVDWGCYYIYNDLKRIATLVNPTENKPKDKQEKYYNLDNLNVEKGYVIFLTNDGEKYKKERKGIFKNYALNDQNGFVNVEIGKKYYCRKEKPYEIIEEEKVNYASVKGKKIIEFNKTNEGKWSEYSNLSKNNNDELNDIVDQLIFEVEKN